jgi:XTP/dITP diphosphohydrolase
MSGVGQPWVLASRNAGKLRELRALFAESGIAVTDLRECGIAEDAEAEEAIEAFETFEENALAKARWFSALLPGRVVVADDSGLSVDALGGAPGVRSKRWSGASGGTAAVDAANNLRLVASLRGEPVRTARFVCAAAWTDGVTEVVVRGEVPGRIVDEGKGAHGFGYDPHFVVDELGMTMAEATVEEKSLVSHRGRAFARLLGEVRARGLVAGS